MRARTASMNARSKSMGRWGALVVCIVSVGCHVIGGVHDAELTRDPSTGGAGSSVGGSSVGGSSVGGSSVGGGGPTTCTNRTLDGGETDVDCGGPACAGCDLGAMCDDGNDCLSGLCSDGLCVACGHARPPSNTSCPAICDNCNGGICTIVCDAQGACAEQTLTCPAGLDCNVVCSAEQACEQTTIVCPSDENCSLSCHDTTGNGQSCAEAIFNCGDGPCDVTCGNAEDDCLDVSVNCGANSCEATCSGSPAPAVSCGASCGCTTC